MLTNINYSIIIPHKNSAGLLQRCLDSIPQRDDIQIIIIDDNSLNIKKTTGYREKVFICGNDLYKRRARCWICQKCRAEANKR
ncbi:glycosyltransferase [Phocaeicola vulgatus]|uniref:glycosyltransferase n=1 Tax=Phocaeicola vulgatus TaxID=821 RepID=UPI003D2E571A